MAYLVRRLDENTAPENYLRAAFSLRPGSAEFVEQADRFRAAVAARHAVATGSRRAAGPAPVASGDAFANEPDSDLAIPGVRGPLLDALHRWRAHEPIDVPLVIVVRNF